MEYKDIHKEVIEGCKAGNRKAQYQLYKLYSKAMYNICLRMLPNPIDAEDMLQNSFMDVFSKLHYFRYESSIGAWIKRIVINNCINFLKKRRLKIEEMGERDIPAESMDLNWNEKDFTIQKVNAAINQLPDGYRVVLSLYLLEGYDHQEIGEILGVSASTSKSQYSRAKKKLRDIIQVKNGGRLTINS